MFPIDLYEKSCHQNRAILADFFLERQEMDDRKVNERSKVNLKYIPFALCFPQGHGQTPTRLYLPAKPCAVLPASSLLLQALSCRDPPRDGTNGANRHHATTPAPIKTIPNLNRHQQIGFLMFWLVPVLAQTIS